MPQLIHILQPANQRHQLHILTRLRIYPPNLRNRKLKPISLLRQLPPRLRPRPQIPHQPTPPTKSLPITNQQLSNLRITPIHRRQLLLRRQQPQLIVLTMNRQQLRTKLLQRRSRHQPAPQMRLRTTPHRHRPRHNHLTPLIQPAPSRHHHIPSSPRHLGIHPIQHKPPLHRGLRSTGTHTTSISPTPHKQPQPSHHHGLTSTSLTS